MRGHKAGVRASEGILDAASAAGVRHLTLFAFSTENWKRPSAEVATLMALFRVYLRMFLPQLRQRRIRFHHLGSAEGLPEGVLRDIRTWNMRPRTMRAWSSTWP